MTRAGHINHQFIIKYLKSLFFEFAKLETETSVNTTEILDNKVKTIVSVVYYW